MPRARKPETDTSKEFVCPECGRTFTRAAALGSHRRTHNLAGATNQSRAQTAKPAAKTSAPATTSKRRRSRVARTTATRLSRSSSSSNGAINRDRLLQTLFPDGIPAKESVIRSVNNWLDEAERLTRVR
jgi:hypothetical protein